VRAIVMAALLVATATCSPGGGGGVYDEGRIVDIEIDFSDSEWDRFLAFRQALSKEWVYCDVAVGGRSFRGAACRSKGNEDEWPREAKPQFMIRFDKWDSDGRLLGLRGLDLEANREHAAAIRDRLAMDLMRDAGVIAPRVNHAHVRVRGQDYGLYQNIEVVDREFLEDRFKDPSGNLFEKGDTQVSGGGDGSDLEALRTLVDTEPMEGDHTAFFAALEELLDVHQVLREMAVEVVLPSWDNLSNGSWNFYWYHVPGGRFVAIPWDLDDCMSSLTPVDASPWQFLGHATAPSRLRELMNRNPAWQAEFLDNVVEVRDGPYQALAGRVGEVASQVRDVAAADPFLAGGVEAFDADVASIEPFVQGRTMFLRAYLGR
jgi:spore coat protein H